MESKITLTILTKLETNMKKFKESMEKFKTTMEESGKAIKNLQEESEKKNK